MSSRPSLIETWGLRPFDKTLREVAVTLRGDARTPKSRFDLTTLRQLKPWYAVPLWLGIPPAGRRVPVTNLFNYLQPPPELGWSVRVTSVRDFRGGANTYDSHNGTDFAIPPGTTVVAAAPGVVLRVASEFDRGGRKVFLDHGHGVVTTYNHLARPLVRPGQEVARGEPIALSGYSGIDGVVGFPWTPPHVHFNTWLDGGYVDPFSADDAPSLWRTHNDPTPARGADLGSRSFEPTAWDEDAVYSVVAACRHEEARAEIVEAPTLAERAGAALMQLNYYPTRFDFDAQYPRPSLYRVKHPRAPLLDLPFSERDYDGVVFPDL